MTPRASISSDVLHLPSSRRNIGMGVHDQPCRPSLQDLIASLHTIYGFWIASLLALMAIKYEGSSTNPFIEHPILMMLFLIAISVYGVSLTMTLKTSNHEHSPNKLMVGVSHICGGVGCELLLFILISPIQLLLINVSVLTLIVMLALCTKYVLFHGQGRVDEDSQMPDHEDPPNSAPQEPTSSALENSIAFCLLRGGVDQIL